MTASCTFERTPGDPLAAAHDHRFCADALAARDGKRWHSEPVVFATRRLLTLARAVPSLPCASCDEEVEHDATDGWMHQRDLRECYARPGYLAYPEPGALADRAAVAWLSDRVAIAPYLAAHALEEFGLWHEDLPIVYVVLQMFVGGDLPRGVSEHPLDVGRRAISRVGTVGTVEAGVGLARHEWVAP